MHKTKTSLIQMCLGLHEHKSQGHTVVSSFDVSALSWAHKKSEDNLPLVHSQSKCKKVLWVFVGFFILLLFLLFRPIYLLLFYLFIFAEKGTHLETSPTEHIQSIFFLFVSRMSDYGGFPMSVIVTGKNLSKSRLMHGQMIVRVRLQRPTGQL